MYRILTIIVLLLLTTEPSSIASEALASRLTECAAITRDMKRLYCYDNISSNTPSINTNKEQQVPLTKESSKYSTAKTATTLNSGNSSKPIAPANSFGLKTLSEDIDSIRSSIVGDFVGWKVKDKITLANGQVWKITDGRKIHYKATNPEITITKGMFDSYRIKVDGLNHSATVVRVK